MGTTRRGKGIEDGCLTPVAVEADIGHCQVGLAIGLRGEAHESIEERAVGRIVRGKGGELTARLHVDADGGLTVRGDGNGRALGRGRRGARVRDLHALASPIGGAAGEVPAVNVLGQSLRVQAVGGLGTGQVVQRDVKVPSGGPVTQVRLGTGLLGGADDGRVHRRGRSSQGVRHT